MNFINALLNPDMPFLRYALLAGILSSIPFGIIGSFVVVKRMTYIAGAVSHTVLAGIGLAVYLRAITGISAFSPMLGALIVALLAGLIIGITAIRGKERLDTIIGTVWAVGMSIGLLLFYITPNNYIEPMSFLFGDILLLREGDLWVILILNLFIIGASILFFNQFLAVSFDPEFSRIRGLKTSFFQMSLILLISLTVILMIKIVGIVMVIALLTIPAAIAGMFSKHLKGMMIISAILSMVIIVGGLFLSYVIDKPTGSTTVILAGSIFACAKIFTSLKKPASIK